MLNHNLVAQEKPLRVVVLGGGGFIGGCILSCLQAAGLQAIGVDLGQLDLLGAGAEEALLRLLDPRDTLVFASARAPCKDLQMLLENTRMAQVVCAVLKRKPVAHVVYLSSDAVYKDSATPLTETSCAEPGALHGVMHLTREVALRQEYSGPLAIVRPTLVYGFADPHNGYGPNRFRRLAAAGKDIVLFGEGEERRDHVAVEDVAELFRLIIVHRSTGIANAVSGQLVSFRELAEYVAGAFSPRVAIVASPRTGPMPHAGYRPFDNAAVLRAFPGFRFKGWREGLSAVHARHIQENKQ